MQATGDVPAGSIENENGVDLRRELVSEAGQEQVHGLGCGLRQDKSEGVVAAGTYGTEQIRRIETLVAEAGRTLAARKPAMACASLLADPSLVLEPDLDPRGGSRRGYLRDLWKEVFLKVARASGSPCGCSGRAFCHDSPSRAIKSDRLEIA